MSDETRDPFKLAWASHCAHRLAGGTSLSEIEFQAFKYAWHAALAARTGEPSYTSDALDDFYDSAFPDDPFMLAKVRLEIERFWNERRADIPKEAQ